MPLHIFGQNIVALEGHSLAMFNATRSIHIFELRHRDMHEICTDTMMHHNAVYSMCEGMAGSSAIMYGLFKAPVYHYTAIMVHSANHKSVSCCHNIKFTQW